MPVRKKSPVGAHVPVGSGLARGGLAYADRIQAEVVQVFVSNPRGWRPHPGDPAQDETFRTACAGQRPAYVHAPYLINFGSPSAATLDHSIAALQHCLGRAAAIGASGVVVHAGSAVGGTRRDEALGQLREHLRPVLDTIDDGGPRLLIEPTAGGGQALAAAVEDLEEYFAVLDDHPRLGVCLDTCHAYAAGHDLSAPGGVRATLNALVRAVGRGRLGLVHVNDSRDPLGSRRDRHETLGEGGIGLAALGELFVHPATRGVPMVVETPGGEDGHRHDVATLKQLRDRPR